MRPLHIPNRLAKRMDQNGTFSALVRLTSTEFTDWLQSSSLEFFPEYTDHGINHLEEVLNTSEELIGKGAWRIISSEDAGVLVLAVLLHDAAMHLTFDSFASLVTSSNSTVIQGFNDIPWPILWSSFLSQSKKYDQNRLISLFGEPSLPDLNLLVDMGKTNKMNLTEQHKLLIGEFIRQHHARLAHEIARNGVPGPTEDRIQLRGVPYPLADLAGIIARSHGLPLRTSVDYLEDVYDNRRNPHNVHAVALMALLRIADYLQIQSSRAPKYRFRVQRLRSPISQREWDMHHCVEDIQYANEDPEAIFVHVKPPNITTYLKIKALLTDIQIELDHSWSVLGEVYGRYPEMRNLGLTLRRVRSSIDNEQKFAKTVNYVPRRVAFETASGELLKLLVGPLYGDESGIGVRELLQNSVDAVLELREYLKQHGESSLDWQIEQSPDVLIRLEKIDDGRWQVVVSDRGIGMTAETIQRYFLVAGASYRRSNEWREEFQNVHGGSKVLRSGKFGVGALAGFLIGDDMTVTTRHIEAVEEEGITFTARLDTEAIEMTRVRCPIGTTIRIPLRKHIGREEHALSNGDTWDWFCLAEPTVKRVVYPENVQLDQKYTLPSAEDNLPNGWHRLNHKDYEAVLWTYLAAPRLTCNGIKVDEKRAFERLPENEALGGFLPTPNVSVFDPNGNLPLNLQRSRLTRHRYPFEKELFEGVVRDFIASIISDIPPITCGREEFIKWFHSDLYPGFRSGPLYTRGISFSQEGVIPTDAWFYKRANIQSLLFIPLNEGGGIMADMASRLDQAVVYTSIKRFHVSVPHAVTWQQGVFGEGRRAFGEDIVTRALGGVATLGYRLALTPDALTVLLEKLGVGSMEYLGFSEEWVLPDCIMLRSDYAPPNDPEFEQQALQLINQDVPEEVRLVSKWYIDTRRGAYHPSRFSQLWNQYIDEVIVPYNLESRKAMLANFYKINSNKSTT